MLKKMFEGMTPEQEEIVYSTVGNTNDFISDLFNILSILDDWSACREGFYEGRTMTIHTDNSITFDLRQPVYIKNVSMSFTEEQNKAFHETCKYLYELRDYINMMVDSACLKKPDMDEKMRSLLITLSALTTIANAAIINAKLKNPKKEEDTTDEK